MCRAAGAGADPIPEKPPAPHRMHDLRVGSPWNPHKLKTDPEPFGETWDGKKPWEFREDDRGFTVGDFVRLQEFDREIQSYSGRVIGGKILYILRNAYGLQPGKCIFTFHIFYRSEDGI